MEIRKIAGIAPDDRAAVDEAFAGIEPLPVACCNWPAEFPYAPEASFRLFHTGAGRRGPSADPVGQQASRREGPRLDASPARVHEPFLGSPRAAPVNKTGFGRARRTENRNAVGCADIPG